MILSGASKVPVPKRDDFMSVRAKRNAKSSTQPEISNLEVTLLVNQHYALSDCGYTVLRLQVAVEDSMSMAVVQALDQLVEVGLNQGWLEAVWLT
jgi:hypothetical protein